MGSLHFEGLIDREVIVYLPPNYDSNSIEGYPVIYAHDGQNLFNKVTSKYTRYVGNEEKSLVNTYNNIKLSLIKRFKNLPNPATFLFVSKYNFPIEETLLPIIKRKMLTELKLAA